MNYCASIMLPVGQGEDKTENGGGSMCGDSRNTSSFVLAEG